jgi:HEAT repeat protein
MYKLALISLIVITGMNMNQCASATNISAATAACVDTLQQAMQHAGSFFVKVHAGEALVLNNYTDGVEAIFTQLQHEKPDYTTGATRVLARLYHNSPEKRSACINLIIDRFVHADSTHPRLVALESLGKLGYSNPLPEIVQQAQTGVGGFKAMARWVLSNGGTKESEDSLAALLSSPEVTDYRGTAYALRFKQSVSADTYQKLTACANRLPDSAAGKVYVVSALFVHTPNTEEVKQALLSYTKGAANERYETAEALSLKGHADDLSILNQLLHDEDNDVRVAAANAIIKIHARNNK